MADARFSGLYMVIPVLAVIMLFVFIMQFLIRIWMINTPKYVRKSVRFPLNQDLTDYIMSTMYKKTEAPGYPGAGPRVGMFTKQSIPQDYKPRPPPPGYMVEEAHGGYVLPQMQQQKRFGGGGQHPRPAQGQYPFDTEPMVAPSQQHAW